MLSVIGNILTIRTSDSQRPLADTGVFGTRAKMTLRRRHALVAQAVHRQHMSGISRIVLQFL
jgi:hypothetical protein